MLALAAGCAACGSSGAGLGTAASGSRTSTTASSPENGASTTPTTPGSSASPDRTTTPRSTIGGAAPPASSAVTDPPTTDAPTTDAPTTDAPTTAAPPSTAAPVVTAAPPTSAATPTTQRVTVLVPPPRSTTSAATTTTIAAHAEVPETSEKSKWWVWVLGLLLLVAIGSAIYLLASRHSSHAHDEQAWRARLVSVRRDAGVTRDLLDAAAAAGTTIDAARLGSLRRQVDATSLNLGELATTAPDEVARSRVGDVAEALRGYVFALEAENLLRSGTSAPTAEALEPRRHDSARTREPRSPRR